MDAFFASVEIRDNPTLSKKPVIVGGDPEGRGVVSAANYIARRYGVHSGQSTRQAKQKCPNGIFLHTNFQKYKKASQIIKEIFRSKTALVESLSLDEAWLDVTSTTKTDSDVFNLAEEIRKEVFKKTQLTCSAGVASNKFLAKLATEENKPNGIFMIKESHLHNFLMTLNLERISGVGKVFKQKLHTKGLYKGQDIYDLDLYELTSLYGKMGVFLYNRVRGIDNRSVKSKRIAKSIGIERTFSEDTSNIEKLETFYETLFQGLWERSKNKKNLSSTLQFKIKLKNFRVFTKRCSLPKTHTTYEDIFSYSKTLFLSLLKEKFDNHEIRLIGISFIDIQQPLNTNQLTLF
jgi:DNA polymerase IV